VSRSRRTKEDMLNAKRASKPGVEKGRPSLAPQRVLFQNMQAPAHDVNNGFIIVNGSDIVHFTVYVLVYLTVSRLSPPFHGTSCGPVRPVTYSGVSDITAFISSNR
jgi:hypothetical protein